MDCRGRVQCGFFVNGGMPKAIPTRCHIRKLSTRYGERQHKKTMDHDDDRSMTHADGNTSPRWQSKREGRGKYRAVRGDVPISSTTQPPQAEHTTFVPTQKMITNTTKKPNKFRDYKHDSLICEVSSESELEDRHLDLATISETVRTQKEELWTHFGIDGEQRNMRRNSNPHPPETEETHQRNATFWTTNQRSDHREKVAQIAMHLAFTLSSKNLPLTGEDFNAQIGASDEQDAANEEREHSATDSKFTGGHAFGTQNSGSDIGKSNNSWYWHKRSMPLQQDTERNSSACS